MVDPKREAQQETDYGAEFRELLESSFNYEPPARGEIRNAIIWASSAMALCRLPTSNVSTRSFVPS